jgi:uncharacterized protein
MEAARVHMPVRTCVGCRERAPQPALLRVALLGGRVVADARRCLPGRGSYVHPTTGCVRRASERGGFARAFRAHIAPPVVLENAEGLIHDDRGREEQRS